MVLEKIRKGLRPEPPTIAQLRAHQWTTDAQKRDLLDKFLALSSVEPDEIAWTAVDSMPEIRSAGMAHLRRADSREALDALVPLLRTRSEAARRAVQRAVREVAGESLSPFLLELCDQGTDFERLAAMELARELPPENALAIFRKSLASGSSALRGRALRIVAESTIPAIAAFAADLALPLLMDEDDEVRLSALKALESSPNESLIDPVLKVAGTSSGAVAEAAFATLRRLLPNAQGDFTPRVLALLSDAHSEIRAGALKLLTGVPVPELTVRFVEHYAGAFAWLRDRAIGSLAAALPAFVPSLLELSNDPDPRRAATAREMTLLLEDPRAIPSWIRLLEDPNWWVSHQAIERLGLWGKGDDSVLQALLGALKKPETSLSAAAALGDLGDPRSAGALLEAFKVAQNEPTDQIELLAALGKLGQHDARVPPMLAKISQLTTVEPLVREKARELVGKLQGADAREALPIMTSTPLAFDYSANPEPSILDFLSDTVAAGASDFHLATGFVPHRRTHGVLAPLPLAVMTRERGLALVRSVLSEKEWHHLEQDRQIDVCLKVPGLGRFRANFFSQRGGFDASFRVIPSSIPTLHEIGLPETVWDVTKFTQGLVLITGPAGCGKSTTLAALLDRVNETRNAHIITVEDPIEFVHTNKLALVNQRQVPLHTVSFARALKAALREDPDVVMIGEMRDLETIALAISASETGHLVFATLSTTNAPGTIDRIINSFPPAQQGQIRAMISDSLKAVISQALLPRRDARGRVAAFEILRGNSSVAALIRESKTHQLYSTLQTGQASGMNTMDQSLMSLVERGRIDPEVAMDRAAKKEPFEKLMNDEKQAFA
ncbi:MAG: PilT/PilU family type 4a pilus ATPase [Thermoanaerobaculia bacterium]